MKDKEARSGGRNEKLDGFGGGGGGVLPLVASSFASHFKNCFLRSLLLHIDWSVLMANDPLLQKSKGLGKKQLACLDDLHPVALQGGAAGEAGGRDVNAAAHSHDAGLRLAECLQVGHVSTCKQVRTEFFTKLGILLCSHQAQAAFDMPAQTLAANTAAREPTMCDPGRRGLEFACLGVCILDRSGRQPSWKIHPGGVLLGGGGLCPGEQ